MRRAVVNDAAVAAGVLGYSVVLNRVIPARAHIAANLAVSAGAVLAARAAGASWSDLGLAPADVGRGARAGAAAGALVLLGTTALVAAPQTRPRFEAARHVHEHPNPLFELALRIPIGTALSEELLFRSAALAAFGRHGSPRRAIALSSVVFGLWHVLPTFDARRGADPSTRLADPATRREIAATVGLTTLAGVLFGALRRVSGSVVAPAFAHAAVNGSTFAAARLAGRRLQLAAGR